MLPWIFFDQLDRFLKLQDFQLKPKLWYLPSVKAPVDESGTAAAVLNGSFFLFSLLIPELTHSDHSRRA